MKKNSEIQPSPVKTWTVLLLTSIELAFKAHQSTLNSVVNAAVRDAMDSVLIPALRELREDILATNKSVKS